ncbi:hypothetical protein WJX77_002673 [Trebouxia sp. C0004]
MSDSCNLNSRSDEITGISDKPDRSTVEATGEAHAHEDFARALEYLEMLDVHSVDAKRALEATFSPQASDSVRWAEEAALWLACMNEVDMEQRGMGTAMQESLVEAEAQKQLERPVHEQSDEQLKSRYERSYILKQLQREASTVVPALWQAPHRHHLLDLLELELKACKWYPRPGTRIYLEQLGQIFACQLCSPDPTTSPSCTVPGTPSELTSQSVEMRLPRNADIAEVLLQQLRTLEGVLYAMPEVPGAIPVAFTQVEPLEEEEGLDALLQHQNKQQCSGTCVDLS